jgi:hypothetical protein
MVGQNAHVEVDPSADLSLQIGFSPEKPEKNSENIKRVLLDQGEERLDQQVCVGKGSVEVDHERGVCLEQICLLFPFNGDWVFFSMGTHGDSSPE